MPKGIPNVRYIGNFQCQAAKFPGATDDCHVKRLAVPDKHAELVTKNRKFTPNTKGVSAADASRWRFINRAKTSTARQHISHSWKCTGLIICHLQIQTVLRQSHEILSLYP